MNRRTFLQLGAAAVAARSISALGQPTTAATSKPAATAPSLAAKLPRWRGFNLLEKFDRQNNQPFQEADFSTLAEWGFDFVRLPLSYQCWSDPDRPRVMRETVLREVDAAVSMGQRHRVHVNLNLHRIPGYCVNAPAEPSSLWTDPAALDAAAFQWAHLARRYQGIPSQELSFNLLNEPPAPYALRPAVYTAVIGRLVGAIAAVDPNRLVLADGMAWGTQPVPELQPLGIAQASHCYLPMRLTHYKASWIGGNEKWILPTWPLPAGDQDKAWDKNRLRTDQVEPWRKLAASGVGVHLSEWGAYQFTPHRVVLDWMRDCLDLWRETGWGWALWNLRGPFGVLDSGRADVQYESFRGHKLDREMLTLLQAG